MEVQEEVDDCSSDITQNPKQASINYLVTYKYYY